MSNETDRTVAIVNGNLILGRGSSEASAALSIVSIRWEKRDGGYHPYIKTKFTKEIGFKHSYSAEHWADQQAREMELARSCLVDLLKSWGYQFCVSR